jgi:hypothetical protein
MSALTGLVTWAFGSIEGIAVVIMLVSAGRWARKGALIGELFSTGGVFMILLGLLVLGGVLDVNPGVAVGLAETAAGLVGRLLGAVL